MKISLISRIVPMILTASLFAGCATSAPEKKEEKKKVPVTKKDQKPKKKPGSSLSVSELAYIAAFQEKNPQKRQARFKEALTIIEKEAADKKNLKANLLLGYMADLGQGMPPNAIKAVRHYRIAAEGGLNEGKIALAEFWLRNRIALDEAEKMILSIRGYEKKAAYLGTLGAIKYAQFKNDDGFRYLKKAYRMAEKNPQLRIQILQVIHKSFQEYAAAGNYDRALKELKHEAELDKLNPLIPMLCGKIELKRGKIKEAEAYYQQSWKMAPASPYIYREIAYLRAQQGKLEEAVENIKIAFVISGKNLNLSGDVLDIYILARKYDEVIAFSSGLLKSHPQAKPLRQIRLAVYMMQKKYAEAYADLRILMKDPELASKPEILEPYSVAASYLGKLAEAENASELLLKKGFTPVPALNLAEIYVVNNKFNKALELLAHDGFKGSRDPMIQCIVPYLRASAMLATGKNADEEVKKFETALPAFRKANPAGSPWDTGLFMTWFKKAKLSPESAQKIQKMTEQISFTAEKTIKK